MSSKEVNRGCQNIITIENNSVFVRSVENGQEDKDFAFDHCYGVESTQQQVYADLGRPVVSQALDGFNGTIFAYGQTGSGKTFTMMGNEDMKGIIPQLNDELWLKINSKIKTLTNEEGDGKTKFMVTVSFLEVYNEELKDLLNPSDKKLKIHEHPKHGIYVDGLCELIVRDSADLLRLINQGNTVRRVASTNMNDQSSRSHSVFTIKIEQVTRTDISGGLTREQTVNAKVNLVDLAGSERASKTGATGATLKEGANINLSLMTLGNVINMLSEGAKKGGKKVIPYRNSKLTRLLQESLGGNSATVMLASISPADYNFSETVSTLKYAHRAKSIANEVKRNEDNNEKMIRELQQQIEQLKQQLQSGEGSGKNVKANVELEQKLKEMESSQMSAWEEKERLSQALEAERQANMNTAISSMMQGVKEQKVQHMKNIKRLTNEKAVLSKTFKEHKDSNAALKSELDTDIQKYQALQKRYDELAMEASQEEFKEDPEHSEEQSQQVREKTEAAEAMANSMIQLLTKIENDRLKYTERRDALKRMRGRLDLIEEEVTEERAELVATAGLLNQNDKLREQIQEEEREKMKEQFEMELQQARDKLDEERNNVRQTITSELEQSMEELKSEIKMLKNLLKVEETKNAELAARNQRSLEYADELEQRLADSEVAQEVWQAETEKMKEEQLNQQEQIVRLTEERNQVLLSRTELEKTHKEELERRKLEVKKAVEEAEFGMFKKLMDQFVEERKLMEKQHAHTQTLLSQAAKDVLYLTQKNQELNSALNQAIYYEPSLQSQPYH